MKKLSVIIVNYNVQYFLELCIHSVLRACKNIDAEVIVVDNNSSDGSCVMVETKFPEVILIANKENKGFSKANNQAVAIAKGEYILFLNPDTVMPEVFFEKTLSYMDQHQEAGALGPRLIDGKGAFAPDSKKSFPTLSVAIFKTTGINRLLKNSAYFNKYYAVHVPEQATAPVEVLSGCCMLIRAKILDIIGPAFDEDYFMYCEDVDLSFRIQQAGLQNIYFPEVSLIHYKGESTKKATLSYIKVFNEALSTFVRKHYSKANATLFILLINIGILLRAVWSGLKVFFKLFKTPIFDAAVLLLTLQTINHVWVEGVRQIQPITNTALLLTIPVYILLWIASIYLNGGYDQPYRPLRVVRGMIIGTVGILAYFGMLDAEYRYSRAVILFSGLLGSLAIVALREVLDYIGIAKVLRYNRVPKRAIIVASPEHYADTAALLEKVHYAPDIIGRISVQKEETEALGNIEKMQSVLQALSINEVVFCVNGLSYSAILKQMENCGTAYDYKIHLSGSNSFIGSNSSNTAGDLYTSDKRYNIGTFISQRNKRVFDIASACIFMLLSPLFLFYVQSPGGFFSNVFSVLWGSKTWIGYSQEQYPQLPPLKPSIILPFVLSAEDVNDHVIDFAVKNYAEHYVMGIDFTLLIKNLKFIGKK